MVTGKNSTVRLEIKQSWKSEDKVKKKSSLMKEVKNRAGYFGSCEQTYPDVYKRQLVYRSKSATTPGTINEICRFRMVIW